MPTIDLTLQVEPGTDVLDRVVCTCRRRNLQIVTLAYAQHQIALTVTGADRHTRGLESWLAALVNVFEVHRKEQAAAAVIPA
jgi:acetolactate synthase regulatory subunit